MAWTSAGPARPSRVRVTPLTERRSRRFPRARDPPRMRAADTADVVVPKVRPPGGVRATLDRAVSGAVLRAVHHPGMTERVRRGTTVLITRYRHPLPTARTAANLNDLCGGRLVLGGGAGQARHEPTRPVRCGSGTRITASREGWPRGGRRRSRTGHASRTGSTVASRRSREAAPAPVTLRRRRSGDSSTVHAMDGRARPRQGRVTPHRRWRSRRDSRSRGRGTSWSAPRGPREQPRRHLRGLVPGRRRCVRRSGPRRPGRPREAPPGADDAAQAVAKSQGIAAAPSPPGGPEPGPSR